MASTSRAARGKTEITPMLTVAEICTAIGISKRTFYEWRAKGEAPECHKLPNGELRVECAEWDRWWKARKAAA